jgi:hypothetical protein
MEFYQNQFSASVSKSADVVSDAMLHFVQRNPYKNQLRAYFNDRSGYGKLGDMLVESHKRYFDFLLKNEPKNLFLELRFLAAECSSPEEVLRLSETFSFAKMKTPPSSHQHH